MDCFNLGGVIGKELKEKHLHLVTLIVHFEASFPMVPPTVRVVTPRLAYMPDVFPQLTAGGLIALNDGKWKAEAMADVLARVRQMLVSNGRIDMESTQPCYTVEEWEASRFRSSLLTSGTHPTQAHFVREYQVRSSAFMVGHTTGNKVSLPSSVLAELTHNGDAQLPSPVLFEMMAGGLRTHVGVWEFSAPEGQVLAPAWLLRNLGVDDGARVRLRLVTLPRGTFLRLQPFTRRFFQVHGNDRMKVLATLESQMPLFAAFTTGDVIEVVHDGEAYRFFVLDCKPDKCVTCIAEPFLDMEIDFVQSLDWKESVETTNAAVATKTKTAEPSAQKLGGAGSEGGHVCAFCKKSVPVASAVMHEAACQRRNVVCERCGEVVARSALEEHVGTMHAPVDCPQCSQPVERWLLERHKSEECAERRISCMFCNFFATAKNMPAHEELCGAKSVRCDQCMRMLRKRDQIEHVCQPLSANHYFCPLCVGETKQYGEADFVSHLDGHLKSLAAGKEIDFEW